jgi:4-carboxymuconolactone decarboxylase
MKNIILLVLTMALGYAGISNAQVQRPLPSPPPVVQEVAPALFSYTQDVLFGQVWRRGELALRDRSIVTLSSLLANGQSAQMVGHINLGLDNGLTPEEIVAIITHMAFYSGWPNAMSAVGVAKDVFDKRGIALDSIRDIEALKRRPEEKLKGEAALRADAQRRLGDVAPKLAAYTTDIVFGELWHQPELNARDRSLVTISALIAKGQLEELPLYLDQGMDNGLTQVQIAEVITHLAFYAGWPRAMSAVPVARQVFVARVARG